MQEVPDPLAGITSKTTKSELLDRLKSLAQRVRGQDEEKLTKLQQIEDRVRAKFANQGDAYQLRQLIVTGSINEWSQGIDFLDNFSDPDEMILPPVLARIFDGARMIIETENKV